MKLKVMCFFIILFSNFPFLSFIGFVSGEISRNKQVNVWQALAMIVDEDSLELEKITEMHAKSGSFIGRKK